MYYFGYLINFFWLGIFVCIQGLSIVHAQIEEPSTFVICAGGQAVCDLKTGLMWEVKIDGGGECATNLHAVDAACSFDQANDTLITAINAENDGTGYLGFNDWRIPSVAELTSIVDYTLANPTIDQVFGPTSVMNYWTSTPQSSGPLNAWWVNFGDGIVMSGSSAEALSVRAVRSGGKVLCSGGQAVCDLDSGLMWEVKVAGGGECATNLHAVDAGCTFDQAMGVWIEAINAENSGIGYLGFTDWRVPSIEELVTTVDYLRASPAIDPIFGPISSADYWSSTTRADTSFTDNSSSAWDVNYFGGSVFSESKINAQGVRAVRGARPLTLLESDL